MAPGVGGREKRQNDQQDQCDGTFNKGDEVEVFYRFEHVSPSLLRPQTTEGRDEHFFPVGSAAAALQSPRISITDGWLRAVVEKDYSPASPENGGEHARNADYVHVRVCHPLWGNRYGEMLSVSNGDSNGRIKMKAQDVRRPGSASRTRLSFVCLRWGHWSPYHDGDGSAGSWGEYGCCICDKYIKGFFDTVYERLGPSYEVLSCFVHQSADVRSLNAASLAAQLQSSRLGTPAAAMYYLWPVAWLDGHAGDLSQDDLAGYIEGDALFGLMHALEAAGIPTRHPHPSHLYRTLASKVWSADMCLSPDFRVPATTRVNRALGLREPLAAARQALAALRLLIEEQQGLDHGGTVLAAPSGPLRGVAKLGFAWEAREVYHFRGEQELADRLGKLLHQPGSTAEAVLVQRYIPHDCEIRVYCLHGRPVKMLYTRFGEVSDDGSPASFKALEREAAVKQWFHGEDSGLKVAEDLIMNTLVRRWICWLRTQSCEVPSAIRLDFFVKVRDASSAEVHIGELTEQGASVLSWKDGARKTFEAVLDSCLGEVRASGLDKTAECSQADATPEKKRRRSGT